jgi:DNA polymerase-1
LRKSKIQKKKVTLLIDGKNLMYVSFTGSNVEENRRKENGINGIYTFLIKLRNIFKFFNSHPDYEINDIICFWDGKESGKLRSDIYPNYKITRKTQRLNFTEEEQADYDNFLSQIERIKDYLPHLQIKTYTDDIVETDDMVAHYVKNIKKQSEHVVIVTADQDMFQLLDEDVSAYNLRKKKLLSDPYPKHHLLTPSSFKKLYGFNYKNIAVYKAVCGDTSDDIEGVGGIQLKGLLNAFPEFKNHQYTLERIFKETTEKNLLREQSNKKPLQKYQNIANKEAIIHRNMELVDLSNMLITSECVQNIEQMLSEPINVKDSNGLKKILIEDGIIEEIKIDINYASLSDFFYPFKRYIEHRTGNKKITRKTKSKY